MKIRLDVLLTEKKLVPSREKAKTTIMSGIVYVDNQKADKAGQMVDENSLIEIRGNTLAYVSRGGLKLEKALDFFGINPEGLCVMDIGASTGGFTDCLLKRGASKVYSIDVGYGQLAWSLRVDPRVVTMERTNVRYLESLDDIPDMAVIDVSFISLSLILPVTQRLLSENGIVLCLIKPQFEAGRDKVGKKGVVRDKNVHLEVLENFILSAEKCNFHVHNLTFSPIKGPEGNIEFLAHISKNKSLNIISATETVNLAHKDLNKE